MKPEDLYTGSNMTEDIRLTNEPLENYSQAVKAYDHLYESMTEQQRDVWRERMKHLYKLLKPEDLEKLPKISTKVYYRMGACSD